MVEGGTAGAVEDTGGVELEVGVGLDSDGNDGLVDGGGEVSLVVLLDVLVAGDGSDVLALLAGAVDSLVGVLGGGADAAVGEDVLEGGVHEATVAAVVAEVAGAVDELGLGEVEELASGDLDGALNGSVGGEGPAGAALALVLHLVDGTISAPVLGTVGDLAGELGGVEGAGVRSLDGLEAELGGELLEGHVSELVDSHGVGGVGLGVVGDDVVEVAHEGVVLGEERGGLVVLVVLLNEAAIVVQQRVRVKTKRQLLVIKVSLRVIKREEGAFIRDIEAMKKKVEMKKERT